MTIIKQDERKQKPGAWSLFLWGRRLSPVTHLGVGGEAGGSLRSARNTSMTGAM